MNKSGIQNIIINNDNIIIINERGGQHIVSTERGITAAQFVWVNELIACAESLMNQFPEVEEDLSFKSDWDTTIADGIDDMDIFDFEL